MSNRRCSCERRRVAGRCVPHRHQCKRSWPLSRGHAREQVKEDLDLTRLDQEMESLRAVCLLMLACLSYFIHEPPSEVFRDCPVLGEQKENAAGGLSDFGVDDKLED